MNTIKILFHPKVKPHLWVQGVSPSLDSNTREIYTATNIHSSKKKNGMTKTKLPWTYV